VDRLLVIVCLLSGCDVVWRLDDLRGDASTRDGDGSGMTDDSGSQCPITDDFAGTTIKQHWIPFENAPLRVTQADQLIIDIPANVSADSEAGVGSLGRYTLTIGGTVDVEVVKATTSTAVRAETYLAVRLDYMNGYLIDVNGTTIEFINRVGGSGVPIRRAYEPPQHRFWRIQHGPSSNEVTFATSADGATWFPQSRQPMGVAFTNLEIVMAGGTFSGGDLVATRAELDNFTMCGATTD
jgi:hypothetical protein